MKSSRYRFDEYCRQIDGYIDRLRESSHPGYCSSVDWFSKIPIGGQNHGVLGKFIVANATVVVAIKRSTSGVIDGVVGAFYFCFEKNRRHRLDVPPRVLFNAMKEAIGTGMSLTCYSVVNPEGIGVSGVESAEILLNRLSFDGFERLLYEGRSVATAVEDWLVNHNGDVDWFKECLEMLNLE